MQFVDKTAKLKLDDMLLEKLGDISGKKILDIGCGNGDSVFLLSENGADVIGVDIDEDVLNEAKVKYPKLTFLNHDIITSKDHLRKDNEVVVLELVAMFVNDFDRFMNAVRELLVDDGLIYITILHPFFVLKESEKFVEFPDDDYFVENVLKIKDSSVDNEYFSRSVSWYVNKFVDLDLNIEEMVESSVFINEGQDFPEVIAFILSK